MMQRIYLAKRPLLLSLSLLALLALAASVTLTGTAEAGPSGCAWDSHEEIDFFATPQMNQTPVGWRVRTCTCSSYSSGEVTPYFTVVSSEPCNPF